MLQQWLRVGAELVYASWAICVSTRARCQLSAGAKRRSSYCLRVRTPLAS